LEILLKPQGLYTGSYRGNIPVHFQIFFKSPFPSSKVFLDCKDLKPQKNTYIIGKRMKRSRSIAVNVMERAMLPMANREAERK
jgi:hypothetical protein